MYLPSLPRFTVSFLAWVFFHPSLTGQIWAVGGFCFLCSASWKGSSPIFASYLSLKWRLLKWITMKSGYCSVLIKIPIFTTMRVEYFSHSGKWGKFQSNSTTVAPNRNRHRDIKIHMCKVLFRDSYITVPNLDILCCLYEVAQFSSPLTFLFWFSMREGSLTPFTYAILCRTILCPRDECLIPCPRETFVCLSHSRNPQDTLIIVCPALTKVTRLDVNN